MLPSPRRPRAPRTAIPTCRPTGPLAALVVVVISVLITLMSATGAQAADTPRVSHVERTDTGLAVLVDVPANASVDLASVSGTVNGQTYPATARAAGDETAVARTAILAIDTSQSMHGTRIEAAKRAAHTFIDSAPSNVAIGIVRFDSTVDDALAPTTDRAQASRVIDGLQLSSGTRLYDGVLDAIALAGSEGQRTIIVISDGADTNSSASLPSVTAAAQSAGVSVDVVAIDQSGTDRTALQQLAGDGQVIDANDATLEAAFSAEASALQRQIAVDLAIPAGARDAQAAIALNLPTTDGLSLSASVLLPPADVAPPDPSAVTTPAAKSALSSWAMYLGVGLVGVGLLVALLMLAPAKAVPMSAEERVVSYADATRVAPKSDRDEHDAVLDQAKEAVASVLARNRNLDQRITQRLDAAGSELKSSEWILLHAAIVVVATLVGLLLGRGNVVIGFLFLVAGAVLPWMYLGFKRSRRRKQFSAVLPETLTLISGSLSAGLSLAQSVDTIVREGAEPINSEFRRVLVETRLGVPLEDAFDGVAERFESRDFAWVVMAIRIQRQVGGNLAELLDTVAATMREREYMRRQVAALAAEGKLSAWVLGLLPPGFLAYLAGTNYDYVKPLFTEQVGWLMLGGGVLLLGLGVFWMSKLVKVEV